MQTYKATAARHALRPAARCNEHRSELTNELGYRGRRTRTSCDTILEEAAKLCRGGVAAVERERRRRGRLHLTKTASCGPPRAFPKPTRSSARADGPPSTPIRGNGAARTCPSRLGKHGRGDDSARPTCQLRPLSRPDARRDDRGPQEAHASDELKQRFLPKMIDGTWAGTMCLTEAHCGTDLGLLRTKRQSPERRTAAIRCHRLEDLHLVRRSRPDGEHRPPGARAPSRRAEGREGHQRSSSCRSCCRPTEGRPGARNGVSCVGHRAQDGDEGLRDLSDQLRRASKGWLVGTAQQGHDRRCSR